MNFKTSFKLKATKSNKPTSMRLVIFHKNFGVEGRLVYSTGESILPIYFDTKTQRPTLNKALLGSLKIEDKRRLKLLEDKLNTIQNEVRKVADWFTYHNQKLNADSFKKMLDAELKNTVTDTKRNVGIVLNEYIDNYILGIKDGTRITSSGKILTHGSVKNYLSFKSQFLKFQLHKKCRIDFQDVDQNFYTDFVNYLNGKNYSPNTIGKHIARLKKLMRSAKEEGHYSGSEHEKSYFKALEIDTEHVYLTRTELNAIKKLDLNDSPEMDLHRDIFLIGCHMAQRISDYKSIRPEHLTKTSRGVKVLKIIQKKTGEEVMIPVNKDLDQLLLKYNYLTPVIQDHKLNDMIKEIAKKAEIDNLVEIEMVRGGNKTKSVFPKYELIKSHTARRTGATNMYLAGIPPIDIMKITGHKLESNFLKYIKVSKEETADKLSAHPYFN